MDKNDKIKKKAEELMAKVDDTMTMWDLLSEESADGLTIEEAYTLYMYLDKVWYDAKHYWLGGSNELSDITPKL